MEVISWADFLLWLTTAAGVNAVLSFLWTKVPDWIGESWEEMVPPRWRAPLLFAMCEIVPLLGAALRVAFGYAESSWENLWWPAVVAGFIAFTGTTLLTKARKLPRTEDWRKWVKAKREGRLAGPTGVNWSLTMRWTG